MYRKDCRNAGSLRSEPTYQFSINRRIMENNFEAKLSTIDVALINNAREKLMEFIEQQKNKGKEIEIIEEPYQKGLKNIRCVLSINGKRTRMFCQPNELIWKRAGFEKK